MVLGLFLAGWPEWPVLQAVFSCGGGKDAGKRVVDPVQNRCPGAEIARQAKNLTLAFDNGPNESIDVSIGPSKTVDRLVRVADQKQLAGFQHDLTPVARPGRVLGQKEDNFGL